MPLDFYHGHGSPYSWRVWLALEAKKIPYKVNILSFTAGDTRKPEFVALNPRHVVPTIVDEGFVAWESVPILEYLDERFPQAPKLYPGDARNRFRIRRLIREAEEHLDREGIDPVIDELLGKKDAAPDLERVEAGRKTIAEELAALELELEADWFGGKEPCALDFVLYPMIGYLKRITFRKPEARLVELIPSKLADWAKRVEALPYFDKTYPEHWRAK